MVQKLAGIYKITSPTDKVYIGQSWNLIKRETSYRNLHCKLQTKLYNSLIKYGWHSHIFKIIHYLPQDTSQEIMDTYETLYWQLYKDCGVKVLNLKDPGSRGKCSVETKEKMSKAQKGKKYSDESKLKMSKAHKGHFASEETKNKLKESKKKENRSLEWIINAAEAAKKRRGIPLSEQTKDKLRKAHTGRKHSPSHVENCAAAHRGKKKSDEFRAKVSAGHKGKKKSACHVERVAESNRIWIKCNETNQLWKGVDKAANDLGVSRDVIFRSIKDPSKKFRCNLTFSRIGKILNNEL